ncbi:MAG: RAMP superfamily CRISPR-associated protein [Promethearchaeota archaeon]
MNSYHLHKILKTNKGGIIIQIGYYKIKLKSPTIIISKKGTGMFYESKHNIPATTIRGALARKAIIQNIKKNKGNCTHLTDTNTLPNCDNCNFANNCMYIKIWSDGNINVKIFDALLVENNSIHINSFQANPPVLNLESIYKHRIPNNNNQIKDFLLYNYLYRSLITDKWFFEKEKEKFLKINTKEYKKSPANIKLNDKDTFEEFFIPTTAFSHIGIDYCFKSTKEGMLFQFRALNRGLNFKFFAIAENDILEFIEGEYKIGAAKSRGYGNIEISLIEKIPLKEFQDRRSTQIKEGFLRISELLNPKKGILIGTFSGITPIRYYSNTDLITFFRNRFNLGNDSNVLPLFYKLDLLTNLIKKSDGIYLNNIPVLKEGYCGVFCVKNRNIDDISNHLSKIEQPVNSSDNFDGWLFINHPVHYKLSIL